MMRICSLVPGGTEVIAALGFADRLVGISHECDIPASLAHVPVMIEPLVGHGSALSEDIDRQIKRMVAAGQPLYRLNESAFQTVQPDLIVTQDLCHVCAVTPDQLGRAIQRLARPPRLVTLAPRSLEEVFGDIVRIAEALAAAEAGRGFVQGLRRRLEQVRLHTTARQPRPRVVCLEWLAPLYVAGHWVPEMVEWAGGQDVLGSKEAPSREVTWKNVEQAQPDLILVMPCGYAVDRTIHELGQAGPVREEWRAALARWPNSYVVDAASYFSRPGPRLVDGVELLAAIVHPDTPVPLPPTKAVRLASAFDSEPLR